MKLYPLLFEPNLHTVVWGGKRLRPYKGLAPSDEPIGESWEVSAIPSSASIIANGELKGRSIIDVIDAAPENILGKSVAENNGGKLPLLIKFIDAKRDLSIQVHPNDESRGRKKCGISSTRSQGVISMLASKKRSRRRNTNDVWRMAPSPKYWLSMR